MLHELAGRGRRQLQRHRLRAVVAHYFDRGRPDYLAYLLAQLHLKDVAGVDVNKHGGGRGRLATAGRRELFTAHAKATAAAVVVAGTWQDSCRRALMMMLLLMMLLVRQRWNERHVGMLLLLLLVLLLVRNHSSRHIVEINRGIWLLLLMVMMMLWVEIY